MKRIFLLTLAAGLSGCSYVQTATKQAYYAACQTGTPQQRIYKHLLDRDTFFVFGRIRHDPTPADSAVAVVAVSDKFRPGEVVDVNHFSRTDSFYGLNLPAGDYRLLVVSDLNRDGYYDEQEVLGERGLSLDAQTVPEKVLGGHDIDLTEGFAAPRTPFRIAVAKPDGLAESLFYPKGTIRSLNDEIFSRPMAALGLYEPAAFLEKAPMMFYALEENLAYKVPVVFVHGIDGSPRDFAAIIARLDRRRYQPWFFYYPSGQSLSQVSEMFYRIFLAGNVIPLEDMPMVIVAHSMGGVVVRDALNRCTGNKRETKVSTFITLASPLGGHPAARSASHAPVVIPSWRDMNPDSPFIRQLHRHPLPAALDYHLFYTLGLQGTLNASETSDGVVPLSCQLVPAARREAREQCGFNATHVGVLSDPAAIGRILQAVGQVRSCFPEDHLRELLKGGYAAPLSKEYSPMEAYFVRTIGHYMDALVEGRLQPIHPVQVHFIAACRGERPPRLPVETAWLKLNRDFPDRAGRGAAVSVTSRRPPAGEIMLGEAAGVLTPERTD